MMQDTKPVVRKNRTTKLSTYKQELIEWAEGKKYLYEHQVPGNDGEYLCETCREVVKNDSPCRLSRYYVAWQELSDLINHIKGEK